MTESLEYWVSTAKPLTCCAYARAFLLTPATPPSEPYSSRARVTKSAVAGALQPVTMVRAAEPAGSADCVLPSDSSAYACASLDRPLSLAPGHLCPAASMGISQ